MKKLFFFTIFTLLANTYTNEPVQGALYAEIRAASPYRWVRIYKGVSFSHASIKHRFRNIKYKWTPTVCFFDEHGRELAREQLKGFYTPQDQNSIRAIQLRLTQLPQVDHAKVVSFKGPGYKCIKLFDKSGMLIARTAYDGLLYGHLGVGDSLPEDAIEMFKQYVSNPDVLCSLKMADYIHESIFMHG